MFGLNFALESISDTRKADARKMFDVELYGLKTDEKKKVELSNKIENDSFLGYIVRAIKYASGIEE